MSSRSIAFLSSIAIVVLAACAMEAEPVATETRELQGEELAQFLAEVDEVVPIDDIEVVHFRSNNACGLTVSTQEYEARVGNEEVTVSVSCTHAGCAGNAASCSTAGCQPWFNDTLESWTCDPPLCIGDGCAPKGCTMKTSVTQHALQ
ncbi:MAG: hypothetical protein K0V04_14665 [Deltaproteobacteria bacterium]|nr:hypothetical protein [Deltaproteobacteria bacterium]